MDVVEFAEAVDAVTAFGQLGVETAQNRLEMKTARAGGQRPSPPDRAREFEDGIRAAVEGAVGVEEAHLQEGIEAALREEFENPRRLDRDQADAMAQEERAQMEGGSRAQGTIRIVKKNPILAAPGRLNQTAAEELDISRGRFHIPIFLLRQKYQNIPLCQASRELIVENRQQEV